MRLVTDGEKFAIKRWSLSEMGWVFFDLEDKTSWWARGDEYFLEDCWGEHDEVKLIFDRFTA